jgi:3-oxoacyl-[acyl-carrier protein] reductase
MKAAIVTGGAQGIGKGIAVALLTRDFHVALVDIDEERLRQTTAELGADRVLGLVGDVTDHRRAAELAAVVARTWGRIDVLVNNAGTGQPKPFLELTPQDWDTTLRVHMTGAFNWCQAVAPLMLAAGGGRIVNISSVSAHTGGVMSVSKTAYAAAKAGLLGFTRGLARELAPTIIVNAICPGSIETELTRNRFAELRSTLTASIPLARVGTPADIGEVAAFLADGAPLFMTGEVIDVDGGQWIN